jgi:hypothetical protein
MVRWSDKKIVMLKFSKSIVILFLLTLLSGGLAFLIYWIERNFGVISDANNWSESGANHGPWRSGFESLTVYYPLVLLFFVTVIATVAETIKKKWKIFWQSLLLFFTQIVLIFLQMYFLSWTID